MITLATPADWRDLQRQVARILSEAGLAVEVEYRMATGRGQVKVDVYAEEYVKGRRYVILVECKHWSARVPQSVIHGFRTVVGESGANAGYIVSQAGFQSGAFSAAELTNLRLMTWQEFQLEFESAWLDHYLLPDVDARLDELFRYTKPLVPRSFLEVDESAVAKLRSLREQHSDFAWLMRRFTPVWKELVMDRVPAVPLRAEHPNLVGRIPDAVLDAGAYREFLKVAFAHADEAVEGFRKALRAGGYRAPDGQP